MINNGLEENLTKSEQGRVDNYHEVLIHLSEIVNQYLLDHPRITLNGLSKRCQVSEPTIRRIAKKQIKTLPNLSTILDLLTALSRKTEIRELIEMYPGPVADFIRESMPHAEEHGSEFSLEIQEHIKEPIRYLIFKLSLNSCGVTKEKVRQLFGEMGVNDLQYLLKHGLIKQENQIYRSTIKHFTTAFENFVDQFRATANFIKPHTYQSRRSLNPLFVNASGAISEEAYKEICKIQRMALKKISAVLTEKTSAGPIPLMFLCALDTLDLQGAFEIINGQAKN